MTKRLSSSEYSTLVILFGSGCCRIIKEYDLLPHKSRSIRLGRIASERQSDQNRFVKTLFLPTVLLINLVLYAARADEPVGRFQLAAAICWCKAGDPCHADVLLAREALFAKER